MGLVPQEQQQQREQQQPQEFLQQQQMPSRGSSLTQEQATSDNAALYHLEFHFSEGALREPSYSDIGALICQSTYFVREELELHIQDCIGELALTNIAWTYDATCQNAPVTVTFAARAKFCDNTPISPDWLYGSLQLNQAEMKHYLEDFIWRTPPEGQSLFYDVDAMTFEGKEGVTIRDGMMPFVECA